MTAQPAGQKKHQILRIAYQATHNGRLHRPGVRVPAGGQPGIGQQQ
jgi:hypothetical protein